MITATLRARSSSAMRQASAPPTITSFWSFCSSANRKEARIWLRARGVEEDRDLAGQRPAHGLPLHVAVVAGDAGLAFGRARRPVGASVLERPSDVVDRLVPRLLLLVVALPSPAGRAAASSAASARADPRGREPSCPRRSSRRGGRPRRCRRWRRRGGSRARAVTPLTRATGMRSLSGLRATSARTLGLISPDLGEVVGRGDRRDLREPEHAVRRQVAGVDVLAGHGDHLGAGRRDDARADGQRSSRPSSPRWPAVTAGPLTGCTVPPTRAIVSALASEAEARAPTTAGSAAGSSSARLAGVECVATFVARVSVSSR